MCNVIFLEQVERWRDLFDFTIRGIDTHLADEEPDREMITNALILLSEKLSQLTSEEAAYLEKERAAK